VAQLRVRAHCTHPPGQPKSSDCCLRSCRPAGCTALLAAVDLSSSRRFHCSCRRLCEALFDCPRRTFTCESSGHAARKRIEEDENVFALSACVAPSAFRPFSRTFLSISPCHRLTILTFALGTHEIEDPGLLGLLFLLLDILGVIYTVLLLLLSKLHLPLLAPLPERARAPHIRNTLTHRIDRLSLPVSAQAVRSVGCVQSK
jgi:hypothetical protein